MCPEPLVWLPLRKKEVDGDDTRPSCCSCVVLQVAKQENFEVPHELNAGAWDPHNSNEFAVACDSSLQLWDIRTLKCVHSPWSRQRAGAPPSCRGACLQH